MIEEEFELEKEFELEEFEEKDMFFVTENIVISFNDDIGDMYVCDESNVYILTPSTAGGLMEYFLIKDRSDLVFEIIDALIEIDPMTGTQ